VRSFQSTLPVRGATYIVEDAKSMDIVSIHAPREGSDGVNPDTKITALMFQSTLPVRGATTYRWRRGRSNVGFQSTLPVRGATTYAMNAVFLDDGFNPRSP